jgi:hypothetical protein
MTSFCQPSTPSLPETPRSYDWLEDDEIIDDNFTSSFEDGLFFSRHSGSAEDTQKATLDFSYSAASMCHYHKADLVPPSEHTLSQKERLAMYKFFDDNIRPARGIEESVGSYRQYMKERSRLYFERLLGKCPDLAACPRVQTGNISKDGVNSSADIPKDSVDFRKWLLCPPGGDSYTHTFAVGQYVDMKATMTTCNTPRRPDSNSQSCIPPIQSCVGQDFNVTLTPQVRIDNTLDALFPELPPSDAGFGVNNVLGSPVERPKITDLSRSMGDSCESSDRPEVSKVLWRSAESRSPSQGNLTNKLSLANSIDRRVDKEVSSFFQAPDITRLRTGISLSIGQSLALALLTTGSTAISDGNDTTRPLELKKTFFLDIASTTPRPNRLRSRSFNIIPTRSRTISVGGI